ncbi:MAG: glycoside hydrolase family 97 N-terminal domain-containing protein, partial [Bacteroidota bacterium]
MKNFLIALLLFAANSALLAQDYTLKSPDNNLEIKVATGRKITYEVWHKGKKLMDTSPINMVFSNGITLGKDKVTAANTETVNQPIVQVMGKNNSITEHYNQLRLDFDKGYSLVVRAQNEGVAYRFVTNFKDKEVHVISEQASFNFADDQEVIFPEGDKDLWSWERAYDTYSSLNSIDSTKFAITPTLFINPHNRTHVAVAEADLWDYPGMYVQHGRGYKVKGMYAHYPKKVSDPDDVYKYHRVLEREAFLAKTTGKREYPWRVVIVAEKATQLLNNELIYKLGRPQEIKKTDYIKPGKNAWEWWHDAILDTDKIKSGPENLSFDLYKVYVDFAARNKLEYVTLDAGWKWDYLKELCDYARAKNVNILVWTFINLPVEDPGILDKFKAAGAVGVKVDLIERDDQIAMQWQEKFVKECAKRELLVVLHGAPKPTGWHRTYPNIVSYEAVRGGEC